MRRFNSYGPINTNVHYYAPRKELIAGVFTKLVGEDPLGGGHYITVWAPRQTGKTWVMQEILFQLKKDPRFDVLKINLEILKDKDDTGEIINVIQTGKQPGSHSVNFRFRPSMNSIHIRSYLFIGSSCFSFQGAGKKMRKYRSFPGFYFPSRIGIKIAL
jgi:hypothetical protein